ncbi:MAG: hypothetical protein FWD97_10715 [Defluviitaleaceae bacterium]|nr:hypothetical protein [Defluviitaleaceae bacterium]
MKKLLITSLVAIVALAGVATSVLAMPQGSQPHVTIGIPYTEASATTIPKEEARQIGLAALTQFFGINFDQLGDFYIEIGYNPAFDPREMSTALYVFDGVDGRIPIENPAKNDIVPPTRNVTRSTWDGAIRIPNNRAHCPEGRMLRSQDVLRFRVDAQTGELVGLQFFPSEDPIARPNLQNECMGSPVAAFKYADNMADAHNVEFANHGMQFAKQANIFEGEVLRAATIAGGWMLGRNDAFELVTIVAIESTDGETATLTFQGRNPKELVGLDFFWRMVDYAIDRDGNTTEPTSQFVCNSEIDNWIYR